MAGVAARHRQVRYQSRTHEPLLAFFSATWGATCERKARTLKLRDVLTVMTQPLLAICAARALLWMCVEQAQTLARRPGRRAVAPLSTKGPISTSRATAVVPGASTTLSAAGALWGCGLCAEPLGGVVRCGTGLFMGEEHEGSPFFNRTICLRNSGVSFTCNHM